MWQEIALVTIAGICAGLVNALAGGGTLITFPVLMAVGLSSISANVTNSVAIFPGFLGAVFAQRKDLSGQKQRLFILLPACVAGGLIGAGLLLVSGEKVFRSLIPFLILFASVVLALQEPLRKWILRKSVNSLQENGMHKWVIIPVGLATIYGGYFGAGMSVIVLAVLGLAVEDTLNRLNALKQVLAFTVNAAAAVLFLFSGQINISFMLATAAGAICGGIVGGKIARRVHPSVLRWVVVCVGLSVGIIYLIRG